jgi:hypothetical protein
LVLAGSLAVAAASADSTLEVVDLRVDGIISPLGVDSAPPHLSWKLQSPGSVRGARQTAWQVRASARAEGLAGAVADVWDSGRTESSDQLNVAYAGRRLCAHERIFWQVRVWDEAGRASPWSAPASFTMGALTPADWAPAQWITDGSLLEWRRAALGFSSEETADPDTSKWVQLDLGAPRRLDLVRLHAVRYTVLENLGFPRRYKLEAADTADFRSPRLILDHTTRDHGSPWESLIEIPVGGDTARFIRLTFPRLRVDEGSARLALSQIEVLSGGRNVAPGSRVTASDSIENGLWSAASLVDGLGVPGTNPRANSTLRLRREFAVRPGLQRALLHISGLGHYSLRINGWPVGTGLLTPGWTDYDQTVLYDTHDVTALVKAGANAAALELASGFFNVQPGRYTKFVGPFRPLTARALLRLEYADGTTETVATDPSWRVASGPTTFASIYGGQDYDARLETSGWDQPGFNDAAWADAVGTDGPPGKLRGASEASPPFAVFETLRPVAAHELRAGVSVVDLGQNASLMLHLRAHGPAGSTMKVIPAELVKPDGSVDRASVGGAESSWNYTLSGHAGGEDWSPQYFYHGARYLQVECEPAMPGGERPQVGTIEGLVTHSASPAAGDFECSDELFNRIHTLVRWAQLSNIAHVITDCPHRERLGWLEQYHLNGPSLRYEWDLSRLYAKSFGDMADAQRADGLVPDIAPEYVKFSGGFRDSPEWGSALILAAWQQYVWTGDDSVFHTHYDAMRRYVAYLDSRARDHILNHGLGDWFDLGPKSPGVAQLTPIALTATAIYYEDVTKMARIAALLHRDDDARAFAAEEGEIKAAFNRAFFQADTASYATGSQTAQAMPLVLGLVPPDRRPAVLETLLRDLRSRANALTSGDVGYRYLLRALADGGRSDVIFAMNHQSDKPGYGYQLAHGATSLTEAWDANRNDSQNHFMLGQIIEWFYADLAGLSPDPAAPGFGHVLIRPQPVAGIGWTRARLLTSRGPVAVEWRRAGGRFTLKCDLPPNTWATVDLPVLTGEVVTESRVPAETAAGVRLLGREGNAARFEVQSGHYEFETGDKGSRQN